MPLDDPYADIIDAAKPKAAPPGVNPTLVDFANTQKLPIGSTTSGRHNRGSKHYSGNAIDIKGSGQFSNEQVSQLSTQAADYGLKVRDERARPKGQAVWGGPHIHIETNEQDPYSGIVDVAGGKPAQSNTDPYADVIKAAGAAPASTPQSAPPILKAPVGGVSDQDREWHLAMTPQEYGSLSKRQRATADQVARQGRNSDTQKRAKGQTEFKLDADYQNRMRQAAGLPIAKSVSSFEGVTGAAGDTRSGVGELRRADDPETSRILRVQKQVTAEQTPAEREMQRAPGTAEARLMDPHLTENEEVLRRVADEQEKDAATKVDTDWQAKNATEIQKQTALYRQDIQKAAQRGKVDSPTHSMKWLAEFGTKAGAGLADFGASAVKAFGGIVDDEDVASASNKLADKMRIHVLAAQKAAEEEGADRNAASKWVQDVGSGFIASAPELAAMSLGLPAPLAFAGGSGLRAYGSDKPVIPAAVHGAGMGLGFELGGEGQGFAGAARKAGTVGAATAGLELASGKSLGEAAKTGATNALMVLPGALRSNPKGVEGENIKGNETQDRALDPQIAQTNAERPAGDAEQRGQVSPLFDGVSEAGTPEPVRHVDLQARYKVGERAGDFKKETATQAEERRAKVSQAQPVESQPPGAELPAASQPVQTEAAYPNVQERPETIQAQLEQRGYALIPKDNASAEPEVRDALSRYENEFGMTIGDLVDHVEGATENPRIQAAVEKYRQEEADDHALGGRGDMGQAEDEFVATLHREGGAPEIPAGYLAEETPDGTVYYDPKRIDAETIRNTPTQELLGHVESKSPETTRAVVARNPDGTEVSASAVSPENEAAQIERKQQDFPNAEVTSGGAELAQQVIADRQSDPAQVKRAYEDQHGSAEAPDQLLKNPRAAELFDKIDRGEANESEKAEFAQLARRYGVPDEATNNAIARATSEAGSEVPTSGNEAASTETRDRQLASDEPKDSSVTSIKNAALAADREAMGLPGLSDAEHKSWQESLDRAKARGLDSDNADRLAEQILAGQKRTIDDEQSAGLELRIRELQNQHQDLTKRAWAETDPDKLADLQREAQIVEDQFNKLSDAAKQAGTHVARALAFRRSAINEDYSLVGMKRDFKLKTGKEATGKALAQIKTQAKEIVRLQGELEKSQNKNTQLQVEAELRKIQRDVAREGRQQARGEKKKSLAAERTVIRQNIVAELARLKSKFSSTHSMAGLGNLDPEGVITREIRKLARNLVEDGVVKASDVVDNIHGLLQDVAEGVTKRQVAEALVNYGQKTKRQSETQRRLNAVKSELAQGLKDADIEAGERTARRQGPRKGETTPKLGPREGETTAKEGPQNRWPARQKQLENQIAELERKVAEEDFSEKEKRGKTIQTAESQRILDRLEAAKNQYQNLKRRNAPGAIWGDLAGIRKAWLLSGIKTHVRNIVGTALYQPFDEAARLPAVIVDAAMAPITKQRSISGPSPTAMLDSVLQSLTVGGKEAWQILKQGATSEDMARHQYQEINTGVKAIDAVHNAIFRFMSASDRVFYQGAYKRNLIDRALVEAKNESRNDPSINVKARAKELTDSPTQELDASAKHDALVSTYNNSNKLSEAVKRGRGTFGPATNFAIDLVMPFDRTPTNVVARILEASPVGFLKAATGGYKTARIDKIARSIVDGSMTQEQQRQFSQTIGRATTGTALIGLGWALTPKLLTADDKGNVFLNVRGHKVNLSQLSPIGNLFAIGARMRADYDKGKLTAGDTAKIAGRTLTDQPLLRATNQVSEFARDPERSVGKTGASLAFSAVPFSGAVRGVGEAIDPAEQRFPNSSFKEQFQRNFPKWRESLPASNSRILGNKLTKAVSEVQRLGVQLSGVKRQEDETSADFANREKSDNEAARTAIERIVALKAYDRLNDAGKAKQIKLAKQRALALEAAKRPEKKEKPEEPELPPDNPPSVPKRRSGFKAALMQGAP